MGDLSDLTLGSCVVRLLGNLTGAVQAQGVRNGDLLFAAVNVSRLCKKQPELLLAVAVEKFIRRFEAMEKMIVAEGKTLEHLTLSEMDVYWKKGKLLEK